MAEETKAEEVVGADILHNLMVGGREFLNEASEYCKLASDWLNFNYQVGRECFNLILQYTSIALGKDPMAGQNALWKIQSQASNISDHVSEYIKPYLDNFIPEERNPFWVWCAILLAVCFAIVGLQMDMKDHGTENVAFMPPIPKLPQNSFKFPSSQIPINPVVPHPPPTVTKIPTRAQTALRVQLPDGRSIAYREQGCSAKAAKHTILVIHGFPSSRIAGIGGVKDELLKEFGVRVVAYDRPGFGESDPNPHKSLQTSAFDMAHIANALHFGEKFWLFGHSIGGIYAWAAIKYIPERLKGVAMFAPAGNLYTKNMSREERSKAWQGFDLKRKLMFMTARWFPSLLPSFLRWTLLTKAEKFNNELASIVGQKDETLLKHNRFQEMLNMDVLESIRQGNAETLAEEVILETHDWGFHLSDLGRWKRWHSAGFLGWLDSLFKEEFEEPWEGFTEPIHIWQGMEDKIVPPIVNEFAKRMVPQVHLHKLVREGHFSYYHFCDRCHREIFETLLGSIQVHEIEVTLPTSEADNTSNTKQDTCLC